VEELTHHPDWSSRISAKDLGKYIAELSVAFGVTGNSSLVPAIEAVYSRLRHELPIQYRLAVLTDLTAELPVGPDSASALLPFVQQDTDISVISTAAINMAMLMPTTPQDHLDGPRYIARVALKADTDRATRVGLLAGLFLLGDQRVLPLLDDAWSLLTSDERGELTRAHSGFIYASMVEFLMDHLDGTDESTFGYVAGSLGRLPLDTLTGPQSGRVLDVRRRFPSSLLEEESPVTVTAVWSVEEYGQRLARKLKRLARYESEPKVLPIVMRVWGIEPRDERSIVVRADEVRQYIVDGTATTR
jgi:hypothetical protein